MIVLQIIIALVLLSLPLILFYSAMKDAWYLFIHKSGVQRFFISTTVKERIKNYLGEFSYYKNLSDTGKQKFIDRLLIFMYNKEFVGMNGFTVTEEIKVLLSASAVQLTFGMKKYKLENLESIYVYPDIFSLRNNNIKYKGATSVIGKMYLSWNDFLKGYKDEHDGINLGLHEMTHALHLSLKLGSKFDTLFASKMSYWEELVEKEFQKTHSKTSEFLRKYSKTNSEEFFAVCVEEFFENAKEFKQVLPEIYDMLVFLLSQNPLNRIQDYAVPENYFDINKYNIPSPKTIKKSYEYHNFHWSLSMVGIGTVGGIATFALLIPQLILPFYAYVLIIFIPGTLALFQKRYFYERKILTGVYFKLYAYAGFGTCGAILFLWLNFLFPHEKQHIDKHEILSYEGIRTYHRHGSTFNGWRVYLDDETQYNNVILTLPSRPEHNEKYLNIFYQYGAFGIKIFKGYSYSHQ